ncbi:ATP12 family chaperone protein [Nitratireductor kimnyeongensis]|uniref:ATP12 family chaperone protein n=1 Tax=Nitratireductor kimnyeongensis TaxID=430679 RepID=A0ABW0TAS4_9HYPH|nr:ATP12 family protein [Nitratireductor kimnyeongensis]QZZ35569.1 ATPase [Nitratireductor kimnyeongensis]
MRDLLNDLENGKTPAELDPVRRAQSAIKKPLPKRFYNDVTVASGEEGGFSVHLDGKPVRTPGASPVVLPNEAAALLVAGEYDAQGEYIDPATMPVTRLVNTAVDGVAVHSQAVLEDVLRYATGDLVCYRAPSPERLVALQAEAWDPVLDWAQQHIGAHFVLAEGVIHVEQPREAIAAVNMYLRQKNEPYRLAALHVMTTLMGSTLLALAVEAKALVPAAAWKAAHVDEDWNISLWGEDSEAATRRAFRERDMMAAAALLAALD